MKGLNHIGIVLTAIIVRSTLLANPSDIVVPDVIVRFHEKGQLQSYHHGKIIIKKNSKMNNWVVTCHHNNKSVVIKGEYQDKLVELFATTKPKSNSGPFATKEAIGYINNLTVDWIVVVLDEENNNVQRVQVETIRHIWKNGSSGTRAVFYQFDLSSLLPALNLEQAGLKWVVANFDGGFEPVFELSADSAGHEHIVAPLYVGEQLNSDLLRSVYRIKGDFIRYVTREEFDDAAKQRATRKPSVTVQYRLEGLRLNLGDAELKFPVLFTLSAVFNNINILPSDIQTMFAKEIKLMKSLVAGTLCQKSF